MTGNLDQPPGHDADDSGHEFGNETGTPLPVMPGFREIALRRSADAHGNLPVRGGQAGVRHGGRPRLDPGALRGRGRQSDHLDAQPSWGRSEPMTSWETLRSV